MFVSIVSNLDLSFEIEKAQINKTYKNLIEFFKDNSRYFDEKKEYKEELIATKDNINSLEYIESVAREKLNMYMPNEKVYIDIGS